MTKKLIALIFYFFIHTAFAQSIPPLINYQGMLTDGEGKPLANSTKKLTFNIYASSSSSTSIWGPQVFTIVPLINGQFNVILGTTDTAGRSLATAFSGSNRYLGIKVGNEAEITPRQQILSTPYAIQAENAKNSINAEYAKQSLNADQAIYATNAGNASSADHASTADNIKKIKTSCNWRVVLTHTSFMCDANEFVAGVCLTNKSGGCPNGIASGIDSEWQTAGGIYCCTIN